MVSGWRVFGINRKDWDSSNLARKAFAKDIKVLLKCRMNS